MMEKEILLINKAFEANLTDADMERNVKEVLDWDSFQIMEFMSEMADLYGADITIEQIAEIEKVSELARLVNKCRQRAMINEES